MQCEFPRPVARNPLSNKNLTIVASLPEQPAATNIEVVVCFALFKRN